MNRSDGDMVLGYTTNPLPACGWFKPALTWLLLSRTAVTGFAGVETMECGGAVCGYGTVCVPSGCVCDSGFSGVVFIPNSSSPLVYCRKRCSPDGPDCPANTTCEEVSTGGYRCLCSPGASPSSTTGQCQDIDECTASASICGDHSVCTNTPGSYTCRCEDGFSFSGIDCIPDTTSSSSRSDTQPGSSDRTTEGERLGSDRRDTGESRTTGLAIGFGVISLVLIFAVIGFIVFTHKLKRRLAVMADSSPPVASTNHDHQGAADYETIHAPGMSTANYEDMSAVQISGQTRMTGGESVDNRNYTNITSADSAYVNVTPD